MISSPITAQQAGLIRCHDCGALTPVAQIPPSCPRCQSSLHQRKPDSINRTWALVLTSLIIFIPANMLPVMTVTRFGNSDPSTIMGGIILLLQHNMYPIALLVFVASILVPLFKLIGLIILLLSIQFQWLVNQRKHTLIFRLIAFIGRWSMLDIFMVSILVALVNFGGFSRIEAGAGASAFACVVITTMLAAISFDSRLLWDSNDHTT